MDVNNFYIVCNRIKRHNYNFHTLFYEVNLSDDDFIKLCENIYKYIRAKISCVDNQIFLGDLKLGIEHLENIKMEICKGKIPFFIWGSSCMQKYDKQLIERFKGINNSLFLENDLHDITNPELLNILVLEYFKNKSIDHLNILKFDNQLQEDQLVMYNYNFGNQYINTQYTKYLKDSISNNKKIIIENVDVFSSNILNDLPEMKNKNLQYNDSVVFHVYAICYNQEEFLSHFFNYYKTADKIFLIDNFSTDKTKDIVKSYGRDLISFNTKNTYSLVVENFIKSHIWKLSRNNADYVIVQNLTELLYFPESSDIKDALLSLKKYNIPCIRSEMYNICFFKNSFSCLSEDILYYTSNGYKDSVNDKCLIFNPNMIAEYSSDLNCNYKINSLILNFKHLGLSYEIKKTLYLRDRINNCDILENNFLSEIMVNEKKIINYIKNAYIQSYNLIDIIHLRPKISCRFTSENLGNILFVVASTMALSWEKNYIPFFIYYNNGDNFSIYNTILSKLPYLHNIKTNIDHELILEKDRKKFCEINIDDNKNIILKGEFCSDKYFKKYEDKIRKIFTYNNHYIDKKLYRKDKDALETIYNYIKSIHDNNILIGLYITRGENADLEKFKSGILLPKKYYDDCIEHFKNYKNSNIIVFTDDISWCRENYPGYYIIDIPSNILKFYLFSLMDAYILSNETFCWWAEFIGNCGEKPALCPFPWVKNYEYNVDIYRDHWLKINW